MKKHELLEKAMRDYPAGTKFKQMAIIGYDVESNGVFSIYETGNGTAVVNDCSEDFVYTSWDKKWAEVVSDRKFVMKSEDGVDLYDGDGFYSALISTYRKVWMLGKRNVSGDCHVFNLNAKESAVVVQPEKYKAFSTKEAAEKWIEEQNKPKELTVQLGMEKAIISIDNGISFYRSYQGASFFGIAGNELEQIYHAYKSLQD